MGVAPCFYLSPEYWQSPLCLEGQEARHLAVLRLPVGAELRLLDGQGREGLCVIRNVRKNGVELELLSEKLHPAPTRRAIMVISWCKAIRRGFFLEKAVELGVAEICCWQARRSQGRMPENLCVNWQGQLLAGAKQCGNPYLPLVRAFFGGAGELAPQAPENRRILLLEPGQNRPLLQAGQLGQEGSTLYLFGPEGGFDPQEVELFLAAGYGAASLGERALRWESAALVCLGLHYWAALLGGPK